MSIRTGDRVVHCYDIERHQVLCGYRGESSSTKHASGVTCASCRELLDRAPGAHRTMGAPAEHPE